MLRLSKINNRPNSNSSSLTSKRKSVVAEMRRQTVRVMAISHEVVPLMRNSPLVLGMSSTPRRASRTQLRLTRSRRYLQSNKIKHRASHHPEWTKAAPLLLNLVIILSALLLTNLRARRTQLPKTNPWTCRIVLLKVGVALIKIWAPFKRVVVVSRIKSQ